MVRLHNGSSRSPTLNSWTWRGHASPDADRDARAPSEKRASLPSVIRVNADKFDIQLAFLAKHGC